MNEHGLLLKQELFCQEYVVDGNATQAAVRAGYSKKTAFQIGPENLKKPKIRDRIDQIMEERLAVLQITQERVIAKLANLGMSDIRQYYHEDGSLKQIHELDNAAAAAVAGVKMKDIVTNPNRAADEPAVFETRIVEFKLADKVKPLENLGRFHKLFTDGISLSSKEEIDHAASAREKIQQLLNSRSESDGT